MADVLAPVDVEQAVIDALASFAPTATSIPATKPARFIRVLATGGAPQTMVSDAFTIVVEVYATKESAAAQAAGKVLGILAAAPERGYLGAEVCYSVGVMALPQNYPNPTVPGHFRYTMTLAPVLRRRTTTI